MKVTTFLILSSVCPSLKMVQPKALSLTILTDGDTSCKSVWAKKFKLMLLDNNSRDMSSKLLVDTMAMVSP